ncbi:MAG: hypothetical protein RQ723_00525 [Desulfuromonadales bacterium]|nr:hypothetical protein [Desulfuromonadales bacterium]
MSRQTFENLLRRLRAELTSLSETERRWLAGQLAEIATVQHELDALFHAATGPALCAGCSGACCDCGRHHLTLTNLLGYLLADEEPPHPDFTRACPFLGEQGCRLPVARRPYNCITFFCEGLDARLDPDQRSRLSELDRRLRAAYQAVVERYPAASLRGLWIALERHGQNALLLPPAPAAVVDSR